MWTRLRSPQSKLLRERVLAHYGTIKEYTLNHATDHEYDLRYVPELCHVGCPDLVHRGLQFISLFNAPGPGGCLLEILILAPNSVCLQVQVPDTRIPTRVM